jgi:hypothetical protein
MKIPFNKPILIKFMENEACLTLISSVKDSSFHKPLSFDIIFKMKFVNEFS